MREELANVPQLVRLQTVHRGELNPKERVEVLLVDRLEVAELLGLEREEAVEHLLHGAAVDEHRADLLLLALRDVQLQDLVDALLVVQRRHDHEVDGTAEVHQVLLRVVDDALRRLHVRRFLLVLILRIGAAVTALLAVLDPQDLVGDGLPLGLVRRVLLARLCLVDVECFLALDVLIQEVDLVRDLVLLLDDVELLNDRRVVDKLLTTNLEDAFDDVLHSPVNLAFMENVAEALKDGVVACRRQLLQRSTALLHEAHADLDGVVRDALEQQRRDVQGQQLADHLLVDQVRHELDGRGGDDLVIPLVGAAELQDHAPDEQVSHLRKLGVDDGDQRGEDVREPRRRHLRPDDRPDENPPASHQVLLEELLDEVLDVGHVDLVHQAVDALPQRLPGLPLKLRARLVLDVLLQPGHLKGRDIHAAGAAQRLQVGDLALLVILDVPIRLPLLARRLGRLLLPSGLLGGGPGVGRAGRRGGLLILLPHPGLLGGGKPRRSPCRPGPNAGGRGSGRGRGATCP
mmetsp:Transcript_52396/g.138391  ORF Transcript_52396/g.138391 Transcript_52396/m.138391 type:complete len:517 (+) Transcript_52396:598-2148(+)